MFRKGDILVDAAGVLEGRFEFVGYVDPRAYHGYGDCVLDYFDDLGLSDESNLVLTWSGYMWFAAGRHMLTEVHDSRIFP